jgi:beta-galactosidase
VRIEFTCTSPAIWRGGYNNGLVESTNNSFIDTELVINCVSICSTLSAGSITVTASHPGVELTTLKIEANAAELKHDTAIWMPPHLPALSVK